MRMRRTENANKSIFEEKSGEAQNTKGAAKTPYKMPSRMVTLDSDMFKCCQTVRTLGWADDKTAQALLKRAANAVAPTMARRNWRVPEIREFYPAAANLLGLNHGHGALIEIRLRAAGDKRVFLPYGEVLGTVLHELAHIEVGAHNDAFYRLLDDVRTEVERSVAADRGHRLGGAECGHGARESGVLAARRRQTVRALMPAGGRAVGGSGEWAAVGRVCDAREMAVAAAERRRLDDAWCHGVVVGGRVDDDLVEHDVIVVEHEDDVVVIDDGDALGVVDAPAGRVGGVVAGGGMASRRRPRAMSRNSVPIRQNAAALAALQRAGSSSAGLR